MVSHHLAILNIHWSSASEYITYLIFHVTQQDHLNERSCDVTDGSSSLYVATLPGLVAIGIVVVEI